MLLAMRYLHILFAFAWFAAVFAAHWNTQHARRSSDWAKRATLFALNRGLSAVVALPALLALGIFGNLFAMQIGYSMKDTPLFIVANVLWVALLLVTLTMELPAAGALGALSHASADAAARGGEGAPAGWARELARWRMANLIQVVLFLVILALMVAPWGAVL